MKHTNFFTLISALAAILTLQKSALAADFCVADLATGGETPSGYPCKDPANVTVDDFIYTGFVNRGNTTGDPNRVSIGRAFVQHFPALNGLNLGAARIDMDPDGVVQLHTHDPPIRVRADPRGRRKRDGRVHRRATAEYRVREGTEKGRDDGFLTGASSLHSQRRRSKCGGFFVLWKCRSRCSGRVSCAVSDQLVASARRENHQHRSG
ncbi:Germin-like protein 8-13 [Linum grandiflorum]